MNKEQFLKLASNRHTYQVKKRLDGDLNYAEIGDTFYSDTLYNRGYNMTDLVETGHLVLMDEPFNFQRELVGKNIHSVFVKCPQCGSIGVNEPLNIICGNCNYPKCITYYDAETIQNYLTAHTTPNPLTA